jgi:hypothetical protein
VTNHGWPQSRGVPDFNHYLAVTSNATPTARRDISVGAVIFTSRRRPVEYYAKYCPYRHGSLPLSATDTPDFDA